MANQKGIVDAALLEYVDNRALLVEQKRANSSEVGRQIAIAIEVDADNNSRLLEPDQKDQKRTGRKITRENKIHLVSAWDYAKANYQGQLTDELVIETATRIEPTITGYRNSSVRIIGQEAVFPPRTEKVKPHLDKLLECVNDAALHPVGRAALFHLHFCRIHPLDDGNGRTARLLQNLVLAETGYAPAVIEAGERFFYQGLLRAGLRGYLGREGETNFEQAWQKPLDTSSEERTFYDFIANKVGMSLDRQIGEIDKLPRYNLALTGRYSSGQVLSAKGILGNYFSRTGKVGQVRIVRKEGTLDVKGDISSETIACLLDKAGLKVRITSH